MFPSGDRKTCQYNGNTVTNTVPSLCNWTGIRLTHAYMYTCVCVYVCAHTTQLAARETALLRVSKEREALLAKDSERERTIDNLVDEYTKVPACTWILVCTFVDRCTDGSTHTSTGYNKFHVALQFEHVHMVHVLVRESARASICSQWYHCRD